MKKKGVDLNHLNELEENPRANTDSILKIVN